MTHDLHGRNPTDQRAADRTSSPDDALPLSTFRSTPDGCQRWRLSGSRLAWVLELESLSALQRRETDLLRRDG